MKSILLTLALTTPLIGGSLALATEPSRIELTAQDLAALAIIHCPIKINDTTVELDLDATLHDGYLYDCSEYELTFNGGKVTDVFVSYAVYENYMSSLGTGL